MSSTALGEVRPRLARRERCAAAPTHSIRCPAGIHAWLASSPSSVHVVGGCLPLRAHCEVRAHLALGKLSAATPTAFHPRPLWVPAFARRERAPRQPHSIRRPDGLARLACEFPPRRSTWSEPADRSGHIVKCARMRGPVSWEPQPQPHLILVLAVLLLVKVESGAQCPSGA